MPSIGTSPKARKPYEFGVKASIAVTHKSGLMVGARTFPGNPYDGHVLNQQLEQTTILLEDTGKAPKQVIVDLGYRGTPRRGSGNTVTKGAISQARGQVGVAPLRQLYREQVRPNGPAGMRGIWYSGLRIMAIDSSTVVANAIPVA